MFRAENNRNSVVFSQQPYIFLSGVFFLCLQYYAIIDFNEVNLRIDLPKKVNFTFKGR